MKFSSIVLCACATGISAGGEPPAPTPAPSPTPAEIPLLLRELQSRYSQPEAFSPEAVNRAALETLLKDHRDTMQLITVPDTSPAPEPLLSGSLTETIACVRPGGFRPVDVTALKDALTKLAAPPAATLILDLRAAAEDADPATAVSLASLFLPKDTPLFTLTTPLRTAGDPVWTRDLMVLIDRDTNNTGEILAAALQAQHRAFLLGNTTRGRTAAVHQLTVRKVEGGTLVLRCTGQRAVFTAGGDPFGKGVVPDFPVAFDDGAKRAAFALEKEKGFAAAVFHPARPRIGEASLVARTNPELPERIARTAGKPDRQVTDRPLQLAVDIIIANTSLKSPKQ